MKRIIVTGLLATASLFSYGQDIDKIINTNEVRRITTTLSADDMEGRKIFTTGIEKAANFIASEFRSAGLQAMAGSNDFRQEFGIVKSELINASIVLDGVALPLKQVKIFSSKKELKVDQTSDYLVVRIKRDDVFFKVAMKYLQARKNLIVLVDTDFRRSLSDMAGLTELIGKSQYSKIFMVVEKAPMKYSIEVTQKISESNLYNVMAILPGKSKKDEFVIFSGHFDHVGIGEAVDGDAIYNGANDDASGVAAVIMLAKYFKELNDNERTLVFVAFTAEEYGLFGSLHFSTEIDPGKVTAMFNIEMIGTTSKWGKNSAYVTGYDRTNMLKILKDNLRRTGFSFYPDPYQFQQLFYRSDNITLARLGVPAHTIITAEMDYEPNYHKPSDEIGTLDIDNMTNIIKAIALSSGTIVSGKDTPWRIKVLDVK